MLTINEIRKLISTKNGEKISGKRVNQNCMPNYTELVDSVNHHIGGNIDFGIVEIKDLCTKERNDNL